jgi:poly-gamma-glutamate capsule biosynthesis protein CapA/YwtB (metallophosphatase superfamily)
MSAPTSPGGAPPAVRLMAVGDVMLGHAVADVITEEGAAHLFSPVAETIAASDVFILNLETPVTARANEADAFVFSASPETLAGIPRGRATVANLANNHVFDAGVEAFADTARHVREAGMHAVGAGMDLDEAGRVEVVESQGLRLGFVSFTYARPARRGVPGCAPLDRGFVEARVRAAREQADVVVASFHAGIEYVQVPTRTNVALYRAAVEAGAALVLGHHPHMVQGLERWQGGLIAYSLGNFIFDYADDEVRAARYAQTAITYYGEAPLRADDLRTLDGMILDVRLGPAGVIDHAVIPTRANRSFQAVPLQGEAAGAFLERLDELSAKAADPQDPDVLEVERVLAINNKSKMRRIDLAFILKNLTRIRPRHARRLLDWLRART